MSEPAVMESGAYYATTEARDGTAHKSQRYLKFMNKASPELLFPTPRLHF